MTHHLSNHPPPQPLGESAPLIRVVGVRVESNSGGAIVEDVSLGLRGGESLGLVGESGAGKTTLGLALLGYASTGAKIVAGEVTVGRERVPLADSRAAGRLRGRLVSYVPQNPGTALNPSMRIGEAVAEMIRTHGERAAGWSSVASALTNVGLPGTDVFQRRYPHQLSGGQQQRVCIGVALVAKQPLVVLDEPATGLDVVTQGLILEELIRIQREHAVSLVYISHDVAVVGELAQRIAVMYAGRIVEDGPTEEVLRRPRHPYTCGLVASVPDHRYPTIIEPMPGVAVGVDSRPRGCSFAPRCALRVHPCEIEVPAARTVALGHEARCLRTEDVELPTRKPVRWADAPASEAAPVLTVKKLSAEYRGRHETVVVADNVSFELPRGRCVALVGESGSGKTTIARTIAGLHSMARGEILLGSEELAMKASRRSLEQRRRIQIIFQNPLDALNPRENVRTTITRCARLFRKLPRTDANAEVDRLLDLVRLPRRIAGSYPMELSGGEAQRVGIARALAAQPYVVVADEITSALDVSVQAAVVKLLIDLRDNLGLALLFITHDLGVVGMIADEVLVLEKGQVIETGTTAAILQEPRERYTRQLLGAAPSISRLYERQEASDTSERRCPVAKDSE